MREQLASYLLEASMRLTIHGLDDLFQDIVVDLEQREDSASQQQLERWREFYRETKEFLLAGARGLFRWPEH